MSSALEDYRQAERYVNSLIMGPPSPPAGTPAEEIRARAVARLERLSAFLGFLGDPQRQYRTIHVAGTSGKGSTSTFTASILTAAGFRTGTHVSPYLQVATEKLQIDGQIVAASRYAALVASMRASVEAWVAAGHERPNYGEFWVAMTYRYFAEERVDVAVIEVGAGGRFDVTNVIEPDVAAVTSIGYDHTVTLGSTLPEIAWHKAGIIKPESIAVTAVSDPEALSVIEAEARQQGVELRYVRPGVEYDEIRSDEHGTSFVDRRSGRRFHVRLPGTFQAANAATAMSIARAFDAERVTDAAIESGLKATRFPGRMETVQRDPLVLLDGAHNPEKVASLVRNLDALYSSRRRILVFGALESKSYQEMLESLLPGTNVLIATSPQVFAKPSTTAAEIAALAPADLEVEAIDDPIAAANRAVELAGPNDIVVITGSLYLVGNVRERWYPTKRILELGTCWPESA
ncbi:MAG TPA: folylpolyglutamate synthase/dihydrofolate synthase family protein [Thermomicrobiales bacterium]|nr:folylpolyglutamate synthase/dihydrofolate synthase family protein [Thermomicrobiales bacterium]